MTKKQQNNQVAIVTKGSYKGESIRIEGTDTEVLGKPWTHLDGNPATLKYAMRSAQEQLPFNGTVYYGKHDNGLGDFFHKSELSFKE